MKLTYNGNLQTITMLDWRIRWEDHPEDRDVLARMAQEGVLP